MSEITHAAIIPLIGGMSLAMDQIFGRRPEFLMSYEPFIPNDSHLTNYYGPDVPYYLLDKGMKPHRRVDVVTSLCPCAGLSALSPVSSSESKINDWMYTAAEYVLGETQPEVYWGENAPGLATAKGHGVRMRLREIGEKHGYAMTVYKTKSLLHGTPQVRNRAFYFFWKGDKTPLLKYFAKEHQQFEDLLASCKSNTQRELVNDEVPSTNPYYRFILEKIHGGITHKQYHDLIPGSIDALSYIEEHAGFQSLIDFLDKEGYEKQAIRSRKRKAKRDQGLNYWNYELAVPKGYIGALINPYLLSMTHPTEDRYLSFRDCMAIMTMPDDFELLNPKKNLNHVCQNVPVRTAADFAGEVKAYLNGERELVNSNFTMQFNVGQTHELSRVGKTTTLEALF